MNQRAEHALLEKQALSPVRLAEVEDFVEFLRQRKADRRLARAASKLSERSFAKVWNKAADAVYDEL